MVRIDPNISTTAATGSKHCTALKTYGIATCSHIPQMRHNGRLGEPRGARRVDEEEGVSDSGVGPVYRVTGAGLLQQWIKMYRSTHLVGSKLSEAVILHFCWQRTPYFFHSWDTRNNTRVLHAFDTIIKASHVSINTPSLYKNKSHTKYISASSLDLRVFLFKCIFLVIGVLPSWRCANEWTFFHSIHTDNLLYQ